MGYKNKFRPHNLASLSVDLLLDVADIIDDVKQGRGKNDVDFFVEDIKFVRDSAKILAEGLDKRKKECELVTKVSKPKSKPT